VVAIDTKLDAHIANSEKRHEDLKQVMSERTREITSSIKRLARADIRLDNRLWRYVAGGGIIAVIAGLIIAYLQYGK